MLVEMMPVRVVRVKSLKSVMGNNSFKIGKYRHYKGKEYEVIGLAKHSETLEKLVVYKALYSDGNFWVRPYDMFIENVEIDGKTLPRFEFIGD
jgi:hypothetical protein